MSRTKKIQCFSCSWKGTRWLVCAAGGMQQRITLRRRRDVSAIDRNEFQLQSMDRKLVFVK